MAKRVFAWQCQYCGALKNTENVINRHEKACLKNPNAKNCILCTKSVASSESASAKMYCKARGCDCSMAVSGNCEHFERK